MAQSPKWAKKARQAQVTVTTWDMNNDVHQAEGFFVDNLGSVLTEYDALRNATRAIVTTTEGKEFAVASIDGANSTYNVARLHVELGKAKVTPLTLSPSMGVTGQTVYILPRAKADKSAQCAIDTITKMELFNEQYAYYTLKHLPGERLQNCPLMNEDGQVMGLVQMPSAGGLNGYAVSATYAANLAVKALDINSTDLRNIHIAKTLPLDQEQALTFIYMTGSRDAANYMTYLDRFLEAYPDATTGYTLKGEHLISQGQYAQAAEVYATGLKQKDTQKGDLHYSLARSIYALNISPTYQLHEDWDMEHALSEIRQAKECDPLPLYTALEGQCQFSLKRYAEARDCFASLANTNMRSSEHFLYAAMSSQAAGDSASAVIALLDSAVNMYQKPYPATLANTLWLRATVLDEAGRYREAVMDYNEFEHLTKVELNASFYYTREQAEVHCRMYQQALNDIERAVRLAPDQADLRAEEASLNYRVGLFDQAIAAAKAAIEIAPEYPDAYRILGVAYREKGDTTKAREALQRAVSLGDDTAQSILDKMQ